MILVLVFTPTSPLPPPKKMLQIKLILVTKGQTFPYSTPKIIFLYWDIHLYKFDPSQHVEIIWMISTSRKVLLVHLSDFDMLTLGGKDSADIFICRT